MEEANNLIQIRPSQINGWPFQIEFYFKTSVKSDLSDLAEVLSDCYEKIALYEKTYRDISFTGIYKKIAINAVTRTSPSKVVVGCGVNFESNTNNDCNIHRGTDAFGNSIWEEGKITNISCMAKLILPD